MFYDLLSTRVRFLRILAPRQHESLQTFGFRCCF